MVSDWPLTRRIELLRLAPTTNPFDWIMRGASARQMADYALQSQNTDWMKAARAELIVALRRDPTSADMMQSLITIDLGLGQNAEAQSTFDSLQRITPRAPVFTTKNPLIELVEQSHRSQ